MVPDRHGMWCVGIIFRQYDDGYKKSHRRSLTILRHFGFGKGIMESRINTEVEELVSLVGQLEGKAFLPDPLVAQCVINVIGSIVFGRRFSRGDSLRDDFLRDLYDYTNGIRKLFPINTLPVLRFVPGFRGRFLNQVVFFFFFLFGIVIRGQFFVAFQTGVISRGTRGNAVPIVKVFTNALWTELPTISIAASLPTKWSPVDRRSGAGK